MFLDALNIGNSILIIDQHIYGLCVNGFRDVSSFILFFFPQRILPRFTLFLQWGLSVFRFGDEHLCNSDN